MASFNIGVGTSANDGTGDNLRNAFISVRKNFAQLFGITYTSDTQDISGTDFKVPLATISDQAANTVMVRDANSSGGISAKAVTNTQVLIGDGTGFTAAALSGDATMTNAGVVSIANNTIDHDELANRFTEDVDITTYTGAVTFDCSTGSVFKLGDDLAGAYTITLSNHKKGQIITIYPIKGDQTVNLTTASGTPTFNKIGGIDYEDNGSSSNILQIECVDDAANSVFFYSLSTFAADKDDI
jgi:hypothetical protein